MDVLLPGTLLQLRQDVGLGGLEPMAVQIGQPLGQAVVGEPRAQPDQPQMLDGEAPLGFQRVEPNRPDTRADVTEPLGGPSRL